MKDNNDGKLAALKRHRTKLDSQKKKRYWLSYGLGLRGNYEMLYSWLDFVGAKECGSSVATFTSDLTPSQVERAVVEVLSAEGRVYLIYRKPNGNFGGRFIVGGRKRAPWSGFALEMGDPSGEDL